MNSTTGPDAFGGQPGNLGRQRIELFLRGVELFGSIGAVPEQLDGNAQVMAGFFGLAGGSIQATNAELSDGKLRLNGQCLEVMGFGFGDLSQGLSSCPHCEVDVVHLIRGRLEVQGALVVLDRGIQLVNRGINKAAVVVRSGVSPA